MKHATAMQMNLVRGGLLLPQDREEDIDRDSVRLADSRKAMDLPRQASALPSEVSPN